MSYDKKAEIKKSDFLVVRQNKDGGIVKITTPQHFEIGLNDPDFNRRLIVHGTIGATSGITGSITQLPDGTSYLRQGTNVSIESGSDGSITISASSLANSALTNGDGITSFSYNGIAPASVSVDLKSASGLGFSSGELLVDPNDTGVTSITAASGDMILLADADNAYALKKTSLSSVLAIGGTGVLANPLSVGDGISLVSGNPDYDNSVAETIQVDLATNPGLEFSSNKLKAKLDGSTLSLGASGLSVASTPGTLSHSTGIAALSFDGASNTTISIDTTVVPQLGASTNTFSGNIVVGSNLQTKVLHGGDGNDLITAGTNVSISKDGTYGTLTINASLGAGATLSQGHGITAFSYDGTSTATVAAAGNASAGVGVTASGIAIDATSLSAAGTRSSYLITTDGGTTVNKMTLADAVDLVDRNAIMSPGDGIAITYQGTANPAIIAVKGDGSTTTVDGTGVHVTKVPYSLSQGLGITAFTYDGSTAKTVAVDNSIVATLTGSQFSGNVSVTGSFNARGAITGSLQHLSDGTTPYIIGGGTVTVTTNSMGQLNIFGDGSASSGGGADPFATYIVMSTTASLPNERTFNPGQGFFLHDHGASNNLSLGLAIVGTGSVSILSGADGKLIISASSGGAGGEISTVQQAGGSSVANVTTLIFTGSTIADNGGGSVTIKPVIGAPEDSTYADGLFTDFAYGTTIGTAIDRFNEVLKGLAPSAAPSLDDMDCLDSGASAKLSFGTSQAISGYGNVQPSTLTPTDNLSNIDINGSFTSTTVSNDVRVACFNGSTTINGALNADISADSPNYAADSFGNGDQGTLKLFVNNNSAEIHSTDLSTFGSGNSLNADSSGFNLSAATSGHFSDGTNFDTFKHRQGTYIITSASQHDGWNYARVVHTIAGTDTTCNYIEWVNDANVNTLSADNSAMDSLSMTGTKNLSGVKYNTGGTAEYRIRALNAYRNVYSTSNITFNGTNCSASSQAFPAIDYGAGENETRILHLTASATITGDPILNASISTSTNVPHPLKSNLSSVGLQSISGILLYNLSDTSTSTSETFRGESYRIISGSYNAQADVTAGGNVWSSATSLTGVDGMLFYNSRLYAPVQGGVSGDFRSTGDGGSIANGPSSNVNYSGLTSGTRTFFRYFTNTSGGSKTNFSITINGSGTIVNSGTSLSTSNIHVFIKLPTTGDPFSTGWMDLATAFATGQVGDGAGCLVGSLDPSLNAENSATFGTQSVGAGEYIAIKVEADASWTGYISSVSISWS
jgi:hypothetical protein